VARDARAAVEFVEYCKSYRNWVVSSWAVDDLSAGAPPGASGPGAGKSRMTAG